MNGLSNFNVFENMIDLALRLGIPFRLIVLAALIGGCSTTRTWSPAMTLPFESLAPVSVSAMSAELEFDAIANGKRLKLDGVWVSEGPDRFRLELRAPTGGVVFSVATNGQEITCYDARAALFFQGEATPRSFDLLLPMAPLALEGTQWLALLLGAFHPPTDALYEQADDGSVRARFKQGANEVEALFGADTFLQTLRILGAEGAVEVTYGKRDADGRSLETLIEDSEGKHRMRMRLRDIRRVESFPDKVFKIRLPQGVEKIAL